MRLKKFTLLCILIGLASFTRVQAQLTIVDTLPAFPLIQTLFGNGVTVSNLTVQCDTNLALTGFNGTGSNIGLTHGVLLASGEAADAVGPNNSTGITGALGRPGYGPLTSLAGQPTFDACVISFDITPLCDSIGIRYVFASEEYNEYVNSINDVFAFFIDGPGIPQPPPGINIALVPGVGIPVSINNVNNGFSPGGVVPTGPCNNCAYFQDNTNGVTVQYDAFTIPLVAKAAVTACQTYRITLAISDASDGILDSGVFLEAGGIGCVTPTLQLAAVNSTALGANVAVEGCVNSGLFTFTLPQALPDTTTFYYTIGGSAISGTDYVPFQDSIVMPAGQVTVTVPVTIIPDNISEGPESIFVFYTDSTLCNNFIYRDTAEMVIWDKPQIPAIQDVAFCSGATVPIGFPIQSGLANFAWLPATGLSSDTVSFPQLTLFNPSGSTSDTSVYILEVEAFQGYCLWQDTMQVLVHPANYADFVADTVCLGNTTSFTASTVFDQLTSVQWSFGDGQNGGGIQTAHTYGQDGLFNVQILTQNSKGCRDTLIKPILIDSLPVASFFVDPVCQNSPSAFANDVRPGASYVWTFGDGTNSILPLPTHVYDTFGVYQVLLVATSARGCVDSLRREAQVFANPQPSFTADAECLGTPTRFINMTSSNSGAAVSYGWGFGDGGISSQISPVHLYNSYGIKNVTLTAIDINGCSGQYAAPVRVYALPVANFTSDSVCAGDNIVFRNLSVVPDGFDISQTLWDFGDGRISGAVQPDIPFSQPGLYTVELKVVTVHGCPDSTTRVVAIHPNPVVDFRKTDVCALDSAQFNNDSQIAKVLDDVISTWTWNWGDGSSSGSIPDPVHVYTRDGTYTVTLTALSDKGCEASKSKEVVIFPLPSTPDIQNDTVCFGDPALLIALPSANTSIIHWYYELSDPYSFQSSTVYNTDPVVYAQTYYVQPISEKGCWGTRVPIRATLHENGNFEIIPDRRVADIPEAAIAFSANGSKGIEDYRWSFGDGGTSVLSDPVYNYLYPGIYEVILRLTDKDGCEEVLTDQVEIRELIVVHIPSAFSPNADGFNDEFFVQSQLISTFSFQVFNRWGQMLYETNSPDFRWNGQTPDGKSVKEGVYMYRMQATDIHGNPIEKSGTITVVL